MKLSTRSKVLRCLIDDIRTVFDKDPAAGSLAEVLLCYPGLHALWLHRIAHGLWRCRFKLIARLTSHVARFLTGIEIHPGATIGSRLFIDHGAGVVIGETARIGEDVLMYQGAVLGGTSLAKGKRHPTVGDRVVIGAGAIVLGALTIGDDARIGSGSVVVKDVPPNATVVGVPGRIVGDGHRPSDLLEHGKLPDPLADAVRSILTEQHALRERLERLESALEVQGVKAGVLGSP